MKNRNTPSWQPTRAFSTFIFKPDNCQILASKQEVHLHILVGLGLFCLYLLTLCVNKISQRLFVSGLTAIKYNCEKR